MSNFVQNYKKRVDLASLIVAIAVTVGVGLIEKLGKKKKNSPRGASRPAHTARRRPAPEKPWPASPSKASDSAKLPLPADSLPEEGIRVSVDAPVEANTGIKTAAPRDTGMDLRSAMIWSEILKRKF